MSSIFDVNSLPEVNFAEKSADDIESAIITTYEALTEKTLYPGDPVRLFLETVATIIIQQRIMIDIAAKQNTLRYAGGDYLDHIGVLMGTPRLPAAKAKTTLKFILSGIRQEATPIPQGTRATPGDKIYFETIEPAEVPAGILFVEVLAECTQFGAIGNNFMPGQINKIVDLFPYYQSVENITLSVGGADIEDDEAYRQRINEAPEMFSTAGPNGAYEYWAKRASQKIIDVAVYTPAPGEVEIRPLTDDGIVTDEILEDVDKICNDKSVRPLTDRVKVLAPQKTDYMINATYYIAKENTAVLKSIQESVIKALNEYILWQRSKLGRNINQSELIYKLKAAGASRVEVISPAFTKLEVWQVANIVNTTLNYGGVDDE